MKRRIFKRYRRGKRGGQHYHINSLENIINYSSVPIIERLERDRHKALMRKEDVDRFFEKYPEYEKKAEGVNVIKILKDRAQSIKEDIEAESAPGMYKPVEKEIRLFPIKPENLPLIGRAERFYGSRERFPAALVHELEHHSTLPKRLRDVAELSDEEIMKLSLEEQTEIKRLQNENEDLAEKAEDEWLTKMEKKKGETK